MNLDFTNKLINFNKDIKKFLRTDAEYFDLILIPNKIIEKKDYILNSDYSIFLKTYTIPFIHNIDEFINNLKDYFEFFYKNLEFSIYEKDIIISMIRFYIFCGYDRRIFTIFFEHHNKNRIFPLLLLTTFFLIDNNQEEYKNYEYFFKNYYQNEIMKLLNADNFFFYYFKKNTFLSNENNVINTIFQKYSFLLQKIIDNEKKVILSNWLFLNLLIQNNYINLYFFIKKIQKLENFLLKDELILFWKQRIESLNLLKGNIPLNLVKHSFIPTLKVYLEKISFYFPKNWENKKNLEELREVVLELYNEFDFLVLRNILYNFFEEFMVLGLSLNTVDSHQIWEILNKTHQNFFEEREVNNQIIYLFYKYRMKFLYLIGYDFYIQALFGLFYEKYKPYKSSILYSISNHPLVIYRHELLVKNNFLNINPKENKKLKKRVENIKKLFFMS